MSYIPPHLRVSQDSKPKPATCAQDHTSPICKNIMPYIPPSHEAIPASSSTQHPHPSSSANAVYQHPHLGIRSSSDVIYRFIVSLHHQHLKFTRSEEDTYTQLQHFLLYTLTADLDHPGKPENSTEVIERIRTNPANLIIKAWKEDLKQVLERFGRFGKGEGKGESQDRTLPVILLRFGTILFHDRRGFFDWGSNHTPEHLERNVETRRLSKTFDAGLSRKEFVFLRKLARKDALHIQFKDRFIVQVEDKMRPGSNLLCTCDVLYDQHNEQSVNPSKSDDVSEITGSAKHVLELKKVMLEPVRHMVGDVACAGKSADIRLALVMEEYPLTEMELCDLKSCFNKASIDGAILSMPPHSRFKAVGISREIIKVVTSSGGLKWYFRASPASYQAYVEPIICQEFCEGSKEWNTEKAILSIEELLQRVIINAK